MSAKTQTDEVTPAERQRRRLLTYWIDALMKDMAQGLDEAEMRFRIESCVIDCFEAGITATERTITQALREVRT